MPPFSTAQFAQFVRQLSNQKLLFSYLPGVWISETVPFSSFLVPPQDHFSQEITLSQLTVVDTYHFSAHGEWEGTYFEEKMWRGHLAVTNKAHLDPLSPAFVVGCKLFQEPAGPVCGNVVGFEVHKRQTWLVVQDAQGEEHLVPYTREMVHNLEGDSLIMEVADGLLP